MNQNIAIIGGDLRIVNLAKILANDGYKINVFALEKVAQLENLKNIKGFNSIEDAIEDVDIIISSIPFSKNNIVLNTPFCDKEIELNRFTEIIKGKRLIAGGIRKETLDVLTKNNVEVIDLLKYEELTILNTISTAEGALQIAMEETTKTIFNSNVLVLGFGRVGKTVANKFKSLGANIYCEARKQDDLAWIKTYGYIPINLENIDEYLSKFDIIINTIPAMIIDEKRLNLIKRECLIIDLASAPGGVDFEKAKEKKIKAILALALPGKVAPETSAEFIKEILYKIIKK